MGEGAKAISANKKFLSSLGPGQRERDGERAAALATSQKRDRRVCEAKIAYPRSHYEQMAYHVRGWASVAGRQQWGAGKPGSFRVCVPAPESSNPPYPCLRRSVLPSLQLYLLSPYDGPHRTRTSHPSRSKADPSRSKAENVSRDYSQRATLHSSWRSGDIPHGFGLTLTTLRIRCSLS